MTIEIFSKDTLVQQYQSSTNLETRVGLHERFSVNRYGWHRWVFDQFILPPNASILELGCGIGRLWQENADRIPKTWRVILTDFSAGMLEKAKQNTSAITIIQGYEVVDVLHIPYEARQFDAVIANHMLYYLSNPVDRVRALSEIERILVSGGYFYASTNGEKHMREMAALVHEFDASIPFVKPIVSNFSLENGAAQVAELFQAVQVSRYPDELSVTDVDALIAFILSMSTVFDLDAERKVGLSEHIHRRFTEMGGRMIIGKDSGLIRARRG